MKWLLRLLPKNLLSAFFGRVACVRLHPKLRRPLFEWFIQRYGVKTDEAEFSPFTYPFLCDLFVRNLRAGVRPIGEGIVFPADGKLIQVDDLRAGKLIQAKGKDYTLFEFLRNDNLTSSFSNGWYFTVYLAPGDYHHIHAPVQGQIIETIHIPGTLWPVNEWSVTNIDKVFAVNERIISVIESEHGRVIVAMVGATNVGSIRLTYDDIVGNKLFRGKKINYKKHSPGIAILKGERIGTFYLGSTVICIFEKGSVPKLSHKSSCKVKFGESLV